MLKYLYEPDEKTLFPSRIRLFRVPEGAVGDLETEKQKSASHHVRSEIVCLVAQKLFQRRYSMQKDPHDVRTEPEYGLFAHIQDIRVGKRRSVLEKVAQKRGRVKSMRLWRSSVASRAS